MNDEQIEELRTKVRELATNDKRAGSPFLSSLHPLLKGLEHATQKQLVTDYRRAWGEDAPTLIGW